MGIEFVKTAAMIIVFGVVWNVARTKLAATGKSEKLVNGMSFIYN